MVSCYNIDKVAYVVIRVRKKILLPANAHVPKNLVIKSIKKPQANPINSKIDIWCCTSFLSCIHVVSISKIRQPGAKTN